MFFVAASLALLHFEKKEAEMQKQPAELLIKSCSRCFLA
jgi:hypothetical protein